jgi:hypothetical protein
VGFDFSVGEPTNTTYTNFRTQLLSVLGSVDNYDRLDSYRYSGGVAVEHHSVDFSHPGTGSAAVRLPTQNCCVLTLRTANATRSGRGRIYLPFVAQTLVAATGMLPSTNVNALVDTFALWISEQITLGTNVPVVVSQSQSVVRTIVAVDADLVPDTQRRRRNKLTSARHTHTVS